MTTLSGPVSRLRIQAAVALLLVAALLAAALASFAAARSDLDQLANVSEPRAAAAADLHRALADLDAQHANSLVVGYASVTPADGSEPVLVDDGVLAALTAQADRRDVARDLTQLAGSAGAAGGSPGGSAAAGAAVQALIDGLGTYDSFSGTEEFSTASQDDPVVGRPPALALDYYGQAEGLFQQSLLPQAQALLGDADGKVAADRAAAAGDGRRGALLLGVLGLLALALLLWWQVDLFRRHRRILNPALLAATAAVLAVALVGGLALLSAASHVDDAVHQGYTPFSTVAQAQVVAADAEAAQSRWLVDDAYRPSLQATFSGLTAELRQLTTGAAGSPGVARTQREYLASDGRLRELAGAGQLDQASVQLTGVTRGQVAFSYYDLGQQLDQLSASSSARFDAGVAAAGDDLTGWTVIPWALLGAALLLVLAGVRPRLAEFA
ncbi:hypothetical protein [Streptacidiphilus cavernicola]|uniref:DUF4239 domain-containing protein n=1 Tax=Streptacidiphilus cavernicola TaxID=3342716 RepID=A0ABV6W5S9_9ACTN